tara:strand:+ start:2145 stop:2453 length:309 start_codon:yes stop_codon:yes gene_type:complete
MDSNGRVCVDGHSDDRRHFPDESVVLMSEDIYATGLEKGDERYIVLYPNSERQNALRAIGRWAANPELSLTWSDAGAMTRHIGQQVSAEDRIDDLGDWAKWM